MKAPAYIMALSFCGVSFAAPPLANSIGIELVSVPPGHFTMGQAPGAKWMQGGEWDESPRHEVVIGHGFLMGATEVTNAQYEQFSPEHRQLRGKNGFSRADDEPVLFVSWDEANAFCAWLARREGKPYRLPTEAEWEYACRSGTTTDYSTGPTLPASYRREQSDYTDYRAGHKTPVLLRVKQSPANAWGLYDLHGNVEEWCHDWYGPYDAARVTDPVGPASGYARVTRGGSHNTDVYYLRSANRLSALPEDRTYYIGFRIVQATLPPTAPTPPAPVELVARDVSQTPGRGTPAGYSADRPYFAGPRIYVQVPKSADLGPAFWFHNHDPAIVYCDNGDLLAIWYSTQREWGRELAVLGSRLRAGHDTWDPASLFFDLADRNDHAPALWRDDHGTLFHFNGTGVGGWGDLTVLMRTSTDNGATWSQPHFIAERGEANGCVESVIKTRAGRMFVPVDGDQATETLVSDDDGKTWRNLAHGQPKDIVAEGKTGHRIAGIHATLVELNNGDLFAIGRGVNIGDHSAQSLSHDGGRTWTYAASDFPPIRAGQRLVMKRLREGPLLVVTFTDQVTKQAPFELGVQRARTLSGRGMIIRDAAGKDRQVFGLFAAVSFDDGLTWPVKKLLTPGAEPRQFFGHGWTKEFITDATHAEPMGYLAATQTPDGRIQLISSALHYEFNLAWLKQPMPAQP
jgi:formylglycine-generating enzyme